MVIAIVALTVAGALSGGLFASNIPAGGATNSSIAAAKNNSKKSVVTNAATGPAAVSPGPFNRTIHNTDPGSSRSLAQEGERYRVMILNERNVSWVGRLRSKNPNLKLYLYVDMLSTDTIDPNGDEDWVGYTEANANPAWFLKDQSGKRLIFINYPTGFVMDVGNAGYQNAGVARVISMAKSAGVDGIFLDDANASLSWLLPNGLSSVAYPTNAAWQAAVYSFFSNVTPQLQKAGLKVIANIGGSTVTPGLWQKWNGKLNGAEEESFTNGGAGRDSIENGQWAMKFHQALWSEAHGKVAVDHTVTKSAAGATYGLATMMLALAGHSTFMASTDYRNETWFPEYSTAMNLGASVGKYKVLANGVYERAFKNGIVLVNPHTKAATAVRLGGTYSGSGLRKVRSVKLAATSGVILVKSP